MGLALGAWLMQEREEALREYAGAVAQHPEWQKESWLHAVYPQNIVRLAQDVERERARRAAAQKALSLQRH